ncbi:sensor histidine kinase [Marinomonas pollencensis]|uniref:histidine kinase n=1 Tax=Marinomonas pollencensis TaxID=491954 RepID=A0A3E0DQV7_9GAMM|nr:ATP-binding protein [Marinomonas pollencensis]REG85481.1 signal transduction histidine kinase [Marinomonas pollencensis]
MSSFMKNDFHHVMIASMNDMKQSVNLLQHTLEKIPLGDTEKSEEESDLTSIHYEVSRMQNSIGQLHNLYLLEKNQLSFQLTDAYLLELIEEQVIAHDVLCRRVGVTINLVAKHDISSYLDVNLLSHVLDIAIVNAIRYSKDTVQIDLQKTQQGTSIIIDDNGRGYPEERLEHFSEIIKGQGFSGLTNQMLAWYYCYLVASMHKSREQQGWVRLSNESALGGSRFEIFLP